MKKIRLYSVLKSFVFGVSSLTTFSTFMYLYGRDPKTIKFEK